MHKNVDTSEQKPASQDDKKSTPQTSASESASSSAKSSPSVKDHVLHEVSVEADGTEDPGAGIEQMVESKKESGSSLQHATAPDAAVPPASDKAAPTTSLD
ncbi:hypothetical protein [Glaciimonas sp. PAMC28666]|uniref:hypothetical protein n=1 Tax=Glaciimonas sp. PAMC28666 TaxID=2807626 RepID=UPI001964619A|nr:hypothetical protein [Glaciimonas sp. PAMC28666]QRX82061.1 hypothetical protein JQN73_18395 [Glaciimonas sp. PAMC28666]